MLTASNVKSRYKLLEGAIGAFPEEEMAYWMASKLTWILPVIVILGFLVDAILVYVFMKFAHPRKDILFDQVKEDESTIFQKVMLDDY